MKKVFLLIAALAAIAVSCNKSEMDEIDFTNGSDIISAIIESSKTKTTIADDKSVKWSEGDMFSIITATSRNTFTLSSGAGTTAGTFTGTIPTDAVLGVVYPHNEENTISDNTLNVTLADEYTMPESDVPMWGTYNNGTVTFKHLAGVLRFELNDIPADYNTLKITADKAIAGEFKATIGDNMQLAPADGNTSADNKVITVKYTASADNNNDRVMFIPLPATTYGSIKLEISKNGENPVELLTWLNRTVECGKIYTAIRTYGDISGGTPNRVEVAGSDADDISSEILNAPASSTIVINNEVDVNDGSTITLPTPATEGSNLNIQFNTAPSTSSTTPLVLSQDGNNSKDNKVKVVMPSGATGLNVNVNMPNTTTTLEGGSYDNVQSSTADNTLIVLANTTIENLEVLKGNVRLAGGQVTKIKRGINQDELTYVIFEGGIPATPPTVEGDASKIVFIAAAEYDFMKFINSAELGSSYTLTGNVTVPANTVIPEGVTVNGGGYNITAKLAEGASGKGDCVFVLSAGSTISNCTFTSPVTQYDLIVKGGSTITGCKFPTASTVEVNGTSYGKRAIYTGDENVTGTLSVNDCTFDDKVYAFNFSTAKNTMSIEFEGCTLKGWLSGHGGSHKFTNCNFGKSGDYANYIPYCDATFEGCTFDEGFAISLKHAGILTFDAACKVGETALTAPGQLTWDFKGDGNDNGIAETLKIGTTSWSNSATTKENVEWEDSFLVFLRTATTGSSYTLTSNVTVPANLVIPEGVTVNGGGYNITAKLADGANGKGDCVFILSAGSSISNCTFTSPVTQYDLIVKGGSTITDCKFPTASTVEVNGTSYGKRAIYTGDENVTGTLSVNDCTFDDKVYAFNFSTAKNTMSIEFEGCTLKGWLSGHGGSHKFTNCNFGKSGDYANYIPYCDATFEGCTFDEGFAISLKHAGILTFDAACKVGETALTAPGQLTWDFKGDGNDNGIAETLKIGTASWSNSATTKEDVNWSQN